MRTFLVGLDHRDNVPISLPFELLDQFLRDQILGQNELDNWHRNLVPPRIANAIVQLLLDLVPWKGGGADFYQSAKASKVTTRP